MAVIALLCKDKNSSRVKESKGPSPAISREGMLFSFKDKIFKWVSWLKGPSAGIDVMALLAKYKASSFLKESKSPPVGIAVMRLLLKVNVFKFVSWSKGAFRLFGRNLQCSPVRK
jgi:hypothetical protein